nr:hypothetical protein C1892_10100 [Pseudomonas sp. MPBD7-1]
MDKNIACVLHQGLRRRGVESVIPEARQVCCTWGHSTHPLGNVIDTSVYIQAQANTAFVARELAPAGLRSDPLCLARLGGISGFYVLPQAKRRF